MELSPRLLTVPNIITAGRALAIPWVFLLVMQDPGRHWWIAAVFALTDNIDGILARLEDKSHRLKALGFRRSEPGRRLDPLVDKLYIAAILVAGVLHGAIPIWFGVIWFVQKTVLAIVGVSSEVKRKNLQVSHMGKYGEFVTNCGLLGLLAIQALDGSLRENTSYAAQLIALIGICMATIATYSYAKKSGLLGTTYLSS